MQNTLVQQGIELMLFGMGTVFIFLALLVVVTTVMSALVERLSKPESIALPIDDVLRHPGGVGHEREGQRLGG